MLKTLINKAKSLIAKPQAGRITAPMKADADREYVSIGLTPAKLGALIKAFDSGDLAKGFELSEQMEEKDPHIASVAQTRRLALTGLPWEIVSAADIDEIENRTAADNAAQFCRQTLRAVESFDQVLEHLALGIGRNLSVAEIVWGPDGLEDVVAVPHTRLVYNLDGDEPQLRVLTKEDQQKGVKMVAAKWISHSPQCVSGLPMRGGLMRLTAAAYMAKAFAMKDWLVFIELFGMPIRVARYEPTATAEEKRELLNMLATLGTDAAAVFSKAVDLELKESSGKQGEAPYERVAAFFNSELSKAWLGQTLTTEAGDKGARALGQVHDLVRHDLLNADISAESRTIRRDLLSPMTQFAFGPDAPVPYFRRRVNEAKNITELTASVKTAVELGVQVDRSWFASELGITTTDKPEEALTAPAAPTPSGGVLLKDEAGSRRTTLVLSADQDAADGYVDSALPAARAANAAVLDVVGRWIDEAIAAGANTPQRASEMLADRVGSMSPAEAKTLSGLAEILDPVLMRANLRGRLAMLQKTAVQPFGRRLVLAETGFDAVPFGEAIAALAERVRIPREQFDELSRQAKSKVFTVAWVNSARMLGDIHEAMLTALASGESLRDFRLRLPQMAEQDGWIGETAWHAELVFRQQAAMATQAGRYGQMSDAGITHWRYSAMGDDRTRPEHAALDGRVFAMDDRAFYPPWDFNCRCIAEPVFEDEVANANVEDSDQLIGRQIGSNPETGEPILLRTRGERPFEWDPAAFGAHSPAKLNVISEPLRTAIAGVLKTVGIEVAE